MNLKPETIEAIDKLYPLDLGPRGELTGLNDLNRNARKGAKEILQHPEILAIEGYHKLEWVSVETKLPPLTINVLLYSTDRGIGEVTRGRMNVDNRFWTMCGMQLFNVTHWMPLPTPPKQD